jgi:predicted phosphoribosyltransferase
MPFLHGNCPVPSCRLARLWYNSTMRFRDRIQAGQELAELLTEYRGGPTIVYGLPRGGVVVAAQVARRLGAPLDIVIPRKLPHPLQPEYAVAAITEDGELVTGWEDLAQYSADWLQAELDSQRTEAARRRAYYAGGRPRRSAAGATAIVVDDGLATGLTMRAAVLDLQRDAPRRLVVAVPVAAEDIAGELAPQVAAVVVAHPIGVAFGGVGLYYQDFSQVTDEAVIAALAATAG